MNTAINSAIVPTNWIIMRIGLLLISGVIIGCAKENTNIRKTNFSMVFLGHTYQPGTTDRIDFRLEKVRFDNFDFVLLGGDLCGISSGSVETLEYLDSIFDLGSDHTLWAVGNHDLRGDYSSVIPDFTRKPLWYAKDYQGLRFIVLNTNVTDTDCPSLDAQYEVLRSGLQDVEGIKAIIVLSHHAIWSEYLLSMGKPIRANAVHGKWKVNCSDSLNHFEHVIIPMIKEATVQGVKTYWISGDFGQRVSAYECPVDDDLLLIGNGLDAYKKPKNDSILLLDWSHATSILSRTFVPIVSFANRHN